MLEPITDALGLAVESPIHQVVWSLQAVCNIAVGKLVGDYGQWLEWFSQENDFGRKAMEAGVKEDMRPIATLDDLLWVIELEGNK
jgi:hypothetical protein